MANYMHQTLIISGEKDNLAPFAEKLLASWHYYEDNPTEGQYELLGTFYPIPDVIYQGDIDPANPESSPLEGQKADGFRSEVNAWTNEQLETAKKKYGDDTDYSCPVWTRTAWREKYWGSNRPDFNTTIDEHDDTQIKIYFDTAWSPIIEGIIHISKDYPLLTFSLKFHEEGYNSPDGKAKIKGGEILSYWRESKEEWKRNVVEVFG